MIPTTIVDNFFETPELIRDFALSCNFEKTEGNYPGLRSQQINEINAELFNLLIRKLFNIFFSTKDKIDIFCNARFQLIDSKYEQGWFHQDTEPWHIAGVVYLNPCAPLNGGTIIGEQIEDFNDSDYNYRNEFYKNTTTIDLTNYRNIRDQHNKRFKETLLINNIFNRALIYDANKFHRENVFFGNNHEDSRLTLVFFIKLTLENSFPPMIRFKKN